MAENSLMARLDGLVGKYEEIELLITDPAVIADMRRFVKLNKEYKELGALMEARSRYMQLTRQLEEAKELLPQRPTPICARWHAKRSMPAKRSCPPWRRR